MFYGQPGRIECVKDCGFCATDLMSNVERFADQVIRVKKDALWLQEACDVMNHCSESIVFNDVKQNVERSSQYCFGSRSADMETSF